MHKNDVTIYYAGGCGGVMWMLNFLLLTRDTHRSSWIGKQPLNDAIAKNWNISRDRHWKDTEVIDDGTGPYGNQAGFFRLTRFCNKSKLQQGPGPTTVLLYAPPRLHLLLARMKRPNWFYYNYYELSDPKKMSWITEEIPTVKTFRDFEQLPDAQMKFNVVHEAFYKHGKEEWREENFDQLFSLLHRPDVFNDQMSVESAQLLDKVDFAFNLVDVVKSNYDNVADAMGLENFAGCRQHTKDWLSRHPPYIIDQFLE